MPRNPVDSPGASTRSSYLPGRGALRGHPVTLQKSKNSDVLLISDLSWAGAPCGVFKRRDIASLCLPTARTSCITLSASKTALQTQMSMV